MLIHRPIRRTAVVDKEDNCRFQQITEREREREREREKERERERGMSSQYRTKNDCHKKLTSQTAGEEKKRECPTSQLYGQLPDWTPLPDLLDTDGFYHRNS